MCIYLKMEKNDREKPYLSQFCNMLPHRYMQIVWAFLCSILLFSGCGTRQSTSTRLQEIDNLIMENPSAGLDSLLSLQAMRPSMDGYEKAYFELLQTIAQHKNRIAFSSDSLIDDSRRWFESNGKNPHLTARSLFYNGLVLYLLASDDTTACRMMKKSLQILDQARIEDDRLAALACSYLGRINDYHTFTSIIQSSVNSYIYTEGNSSNYFHSYRLSFECSYENMNCSFYLNDDATINGEYNSTILKTYNDINIIIHNDIDNYFNMVSDNDLILNVPEDIFNNDLEKSDYINSYIHSFINYNRNPFVTYSFDRFLMIIKRVEYFSSFNSRPKISYLKKVNIVFDYSDSEYIDLYKKFSEGTITINSDVVINENIIDKYLNDIYYYIYPSDSSTYYNLVRAGNIKNNKVIVELNAFNRTNDSLISSESHYLDIVVNNDTSDFSFVVNNDLLINFPEELFDSETDKNNFVSTYINNMSTSFSSNGSVNYSYKQIENHANIHGCHDTGVFLAKHHYKGNTDNPE